MFEKGRQLEPWEVRLRLKKRKAVIIKGVDQLTWPLLGKKL